MNTIKDLKEFLNKYPENTKIQFYIEKDNVFFNISPILPSYGEMHVNNGDEVLFITMPIPYNAINYLQNCY